MSETEKTGQTPESSAPGTDALVGSMAQAAAQMDVERQARETQAEKEKAAKAAATASPKPAVETAANAPALSSRQNAWAGFPSVALFFKNFFKIRDEPTVWGRLAMGGACLGLILGFWFWATSGEAEERLISPAILGSPLEVLDSFQSLWFDRALTRSIGASLWRVIQGAFLAALIGIPLGFLAGAFRRIDAFLMPVSVFGRNVPIAALVPLTLLWFGIEEFQKVMFIFVASVAFIFYDTAQAVMGVRQEYLDTAYTLGASRRQVFAKVLMSLAAPEVFNSIRLIVGLGFGYIILAEMVNAERGLGQLILISQRRGPKEHVYLILLVITILAFGLDRLIFLLQRQLFPYRFRK
ncbi:MAG: ABC transporter permease [Myxococcales bacterium]|nr:MAG: ABC transporter permease [Myxococcales bacterium]